MAHFTCVGSTVDELRGRLDDMASVGDRQRPRAARRPARRRGGVDEDAGRPRVLARARRADPRRLPVQHRRGLLPRDAHPRHERRGRPLLPQARRSRPARPSSSRSSSSTTGCTSTSSAARATSASRCRSCRASCRSPTSSSSSASPRCAARRSPAGCAASCTSAADQPEAVHDFGVAYATMQCAELLSQRRARDPLLHAQPLAGDARDPQRAEAAAAVGERRLRHELDVELLGHGRAAVRRARSARRPSRPGGRCRRPTRRGTSASR